MAKPAAVLDACVLYPASLRDLLLWLAIGETYRPQWTDRIHDEWMNALLSNRIDLSREKLQRTRNAMESAVPDALVTSYEGRIENIKLPDLDDRHVVAAALHCGANTIVTYNLKDFPNKYLADLGIAAMHPDPFIRQLFESDPAAVCAAMREQQALMKNPPHSMEELLNELLARELVETVAMWRKLNTN